ncbi:hypothetical protein B0H14DRAFT_184653 [Mycena olivaceomarginata]|nr:hypothetical protein B0H14DRAFT_184653 [Mycena olivaceomarginata]
MCFSLQVFHPIKFSCPDTLDFNLSGPHPHATHPTFQPIYTHRASFYLPRCPFQVISPGCTPPLRTTSPSLPQHPLLPASPQPCAALRAHAQLRRLRHRPAPLLYMHPERRDKLVHRVFCDLPHKRHCFWPRPLVADVDEAVVHAHLQLRGGLIRPAPLVVKFSERLQSCNNKYTNMNAWHRNDAQYDGLHITVVPHPQRKPLRVALQKQSQDMKPRTPLVGLHSEGPASYWIVKSCRTARERSRAKAQAAEKAAARNEVAKQIIQCFLRDQAGSRPVNEISKKP